jgi:hypothetical protein
VSRAIGLHTYAQEKGPNQFVEGNLPASARGNWYATCRAADPGQAIETSEAQEAVAGLTYSLI